MLVQILLQLRLVESAGFIEKRNERFASRFHLLAQHSFAEVLIALESESCASAPFTLR